MPEFTSLRRPSNDPEELKEQLLRELEKLRTQGKDAEEPDLYQAYLEYAESLAWEGVARGNLDAPQEILDLLFAAHPFAARFLPEIDDPVERAALEVEAAIRSLHLATETLESVRTEVRLADPRSKTEREILRVLYETREYLRRGDIFERLGLEITVVRVGQILVHLYHEGLLLRVHGRAQGNPNAAFYALSPRGLEVYRSLIGEKPLVEELEKSEHLLVVEEPMEEEPLPAAALEERIERVVEVAVDSTVKEWWRSLADGVLQSSAGTVGQPIQNTLKKVSWHEGTADFYSKTLRSVVISKKTLNEADPESSSRGGYHLPAKAELPPASASRV